MTKIKIFENHRVRILEEDCNKFLEELADNPQVYDITIQSTESSVYDQEARNGYINHTFTVVWKETT